jgi:beta-lactamase class A
MTASAMSMLVALAFATPPDPAARPPLWLRDRAGDVENDLWGPVDPTLQTDIEQVFFTEPTFARARDEGRFSLVLVDITDPRQLRTAMVNPDREVFTASMSKIAVLLGVVDKLRHNPQGLTLAAVRHRLDEMIKRSSNEAAIDLYRTVGHDAVAGAVLRHGLNDPEHGGLWWSSGGPARGSPGTGLPIAGTARQAARYFVLMEQGRLVSPDDSRIIKDVLRDAILALFSKGIVKKFPDVRYYGKPGIYGLNVSEGMLLEAERCRYVLAVVTTGLAYEDPAFQRFGQRIHERMMARHPIRETAPALSSVGGAPAR